MADVWFEGAMFEIEINNRKISAVEGQSIIEAADAAGIYIPRFCYHKKLSIAANCRMCLVEISNSKKPVPACATPIMPDLKVMTESEMAVKAQRDVMEFLLINHPLDCPICDQGGMCDLQDLSMGYGRADSNYNESKRSVCSENIGPLIETEMTRCINCTRCVRFGDEIAGLRELGVVNRGEDSEISTYVKHFIQSELSGNIIDLCPVGALTSKPTRYEARGWELREHPSIAMHDCVGSNIFVHSFFQEYEDHRKIKQIVPRQNEDINEVWISDRDRFGFLGLRSVERVTQPHMKIDGQWQMVSWKEALTHVAEKTQSIIDEKGASEIAALASPNCTVEEFYLLQKFMRRLGSPNIDHRIRQHDFSDQDSMGAFPGFSIKIAELENRDAFLLLGSDIRSDAPMIAHRVRQASEEDAKVFSISAIDYLTHFPVQHKLIAANIVFPLAEVTKALCEVRNMNVSELQDISVSDVARKIAQGLAAAEAPIIIVGTQALEHPHLSQIHALLNRLNIPLAVVTHGANTAGAYLAGALPNRGPAQKIAKKQGKNAKALLTDQAVSAYFLLNIEPELDSAYPEAALKALHQASFVVCMTTHASAAMKSYADVILPAAPFTEQSGTFINAEGTWQFYKAATAPKDQAKPIWKIINVLAGLMQLNDFHYSEAEQIAHELKKELENSSSENRVAPPTLKIPAKNMGLIRLAPWHMYQVDNMVRRSVPLQETISEEYRVVRLHEKTAEKFGLSQSAFACVTQNNKHITLPLMIDNRIAEDAVFLASALSETAGFGETMAPITVERGVK
jgi:NADH-quinone oxidoreductase subunit G